MRYRMMLLAGFIISGLLGATDVLAQEYTVQKGDTLWDISNKFRGTPYEWTDLWYINRDVPILNPHLIYPGQRLQVTPKPGVSPALSLPAKSDTFSQPQDFSQPQTFSQPQPFDQPASQPGQPDTRGFGQFLKTDAQNSYYFSLIDQIGYIRKEPTAPFGFIFKVKDDKKMISVGDTVYIKETGGVDKTLIIGRRYSIFRVLPSLINKESNEVIGAQHLFMGFLEINQKEPNLSVGKVVNAFRPIKVGDMIIPYSQRTPKIDFINAPRELTGRVLISEEHANLIGSDMVAFIDKGFSDGVKPGQRLLIYEQEFTKIDPKSAETVALPPIDYAMLLVLMTEETTSTVIVTDSVKNLFPGAMFRGFSE